MLSQGASHSAGLQYAPSPPPCRAPSRTTPTVQSSRRRASRESRARASRSLAGARAGWEPAPGCPGRPPHEGKESRSPESLKRSSRDSGEDEADFRKLPWPSSGVLRESAKQTQGPSKALPRRRGSSRLCPRHRYNELSANTVFLAWRRRPLFSNKLRCSGFWNHVLCTSETG